MNRFLSTPLRPHRDRMPLTVTKSPQDRKMLVFRLTTSDLSVMKLRRESGPSKPEMTLIRNQESLG